MQKESNETADGSTKGLNLIKEIVSYTENLHSEIESENEVVNSICCCKESRYSFVVHYSRNSFPNKYFYS